MDRWLGDRTFVYWSVAIFSGVLSVYSVSAADLINSDGIRYIDVAKAFLNEGIGPAFNLYHWPFYSILIALIHKVSGLGFEHAAYLLNALLLMLSCVVFVRLYEEISGTDSRVWLGALLVLALPVLNGYRDFVIRGFGFWAFALLALYYFIHYSRSCGLQDALKWQLSIVVATLFRVEGVAFLAFAPLVFLFIADTRKKILGHIFRLNVLFIGLSAAGVAVILALGLLNLSTGMDNPYQDQIDRIHQIGYASPMVLIRALSTEAEILYARNTMMSSIGDARLILASGVLALVLVKVSTNIGLPFLAVWVYGAYRKWLRLSRESHIVAWFAAIAMLTLIPVAGNFFFLSSRHTVLTVLLISLVTFQYVDYLLRELSIRGLYKWSVAAWGLILVLFLDGVISTGASKGNIRDAGEWLSAEKSIGDKVACNEVRLRFYSAERCQLVVFDDGDPAGTIGDLKYAGYRYLLLWVGRKDRQLRMSLDNDPGLGLEKEFLNESGSSVRFYRVEPEGPPASSAIPNN